MAVRKRTRKVTNPKKKTEEVQAAPEATPKASSKPKTRTGLKSSKKSSPRASAPATTKSKSSSSPRSSKSKSGGAKRPRRAVAPSSQGGGAGMGLVAGGVALVVLLIIGVALSGGNDSPKESDPELAQNESLSSEPNNTLSTTPTPNSTSTSETPEPNKPSTEEKLPEQDLKSEEPSPQITQTKKTQPAQEVTKAKSPPKPPVQKAPPPPPPVKKEPVVAQVKKNPLDQRARARPGFLSGMSGSSGGFKTPTIKGVEKIISLKGIKEDATDEMKSIHIHVPSDYQKDQAHPVFFFIQGHPNSGLEKATHGEYFLAVRVALLDKIAQEGLDPTEYGFESLPDLAEKAYESVSETFEQINTEHSIAGGSGKGAELFEQLHSESGGEYDNRYKGFVLIGEQADSTEITSKNIFKESSGTLEEHAEAIIAFNFGKVTYPKVAKEFKKIKSSMKKKRYSSALKSISKLEEETPYYTNQIKGIQKEIEDIAYEEYKTLNIDQLSADPKKGYSRVQKFIKDFPGTRRIADAEKILEDLKIAKETAGKGAFLYDEKYGKLAIFPPSNAWNQPIDKKPVHPQSQTFINSIGANGTLFVDLSIPFEVVKNGKMAPITINAYPRESDPGPYPIPPNARIEGGGDRHIIVVDYGRKKVYELFHSQREANGGFSGDSGAIFDLTSNKGRPKGWTSADAAGLCIFAGLLRYDEVVLQKQIRHALRFTVRRSQAAYVHPASHHAGRDDPSLPPMGLRFRLKKGFPETGFSRNALVVVRALKKYGLIIADNGSDWFINGSPGPTRYLKGNDLAKIKGSDMEVVNTGKFEK